MRSIKMYRLAVCLFCVLTSSATLSNMVTRPASFMERAATGLENTVEALGGFVQSRNRGLRPKKNSKGRYRLFISSFFVNVGVPRSNPLVEADAVSQHIVSWGLRGPRRSPARYAFKDR